MKKSGHFSIPIEITLAVEGVTPAKTKDANEWALKICLHGLRIGTLLFLKVRCLRIYSLVLIKVPCVNGFAASFRKLGKSMAKDILLKYLFYIVCFSAYTLFSAPLYFQKI